MDHINIFAGREDPECGESSGEKEVFARRLLSARSRQYFRRQQEQEVRQLGRGPEEVGEDVVAPDDIERRASTTTTAAAAVPSAAQRYNPVVR